MRVAVVAALRDCSLKPAGLSSPNLANILMKELDIDAIHRQPLETAPRFELFLRGVRSEDRSMPRRDRRGGRSRSSRADLRERQQAHHRGIGGRVPVRLSSAGGSSAGEAQVAPPAGQADPQEAPAHHIRRAGESCQSTQGFIPRSRVPQLMAAIAESHFPHISEGICGNFPLGDLSGNATRAR